MPADAAAPLVDEQALSSLLVHSAHRISHSMGAPVRALVSFSQLLAEEHSENLSTEAQEYLSLIVESGDRLGRMFEALLDMANISKMPQSFGPVDCNKVLYRVVAMAKLSALGSSANIRIGPMPTLDAHQEKLTQVFTLLLDNALKFQPSGNQPDISITSEPIAEGWKFIVKDNGIGIDSMFHEAVFDLFRRLHSSVEYSGVGTGLTIAKTIITQHRGKIWCESPRGGGACFLFTIGRGLGAKDNENNILN